MFEPLELLAILLYMGFFICFYFPLFVSYLSLFYLICTFSVSLLFVFIFSYLQLVLQCHQALAMDVHPGGDEAVAAIISGKNKYYKRHTPSYLTH